MFRYLFIAFTAFSVFVFSSCQECVEGSGSVIEESRTLKNFEEVELNSSANLILRPVSGTDPLKTTVQAQENLLPFIKTTVTGTKLVVDIEGCISATEKMKVFVDVRNLTKIINDGSGDVSAEGLIKGEQLTLQNEGSGDINLEVDQAKFVVDNDGSGDIRLKGNVDQLEVDNDGSGNIEAYELKTNSAKINNDGSGDIELFVRESLDVKLTGSGDISYEGNPQKIDQNNRGSGKVSRRN